MILSDRDLRRQIQQGRLRVEPFDPRAVQPSSIDLRVSDEFRVFANNRHPYIDVRRPMEDLTELVRATDAEPFILHPGEFVLASTLEQVSLPDDLVGRLEGKSSLGRLGLLIHSSLPGSEPVLFLDTDSGRLATRPIADIVGQSLRGAVVSFDPGTFDVAYHQVTGWYEGPPDRIFEVTLASGRRVRLTAGHNLFTLDHQGDLAKVRTGALVAGTATRRPPGRATASWRGHARSSGRSSTAPWTGTHRAGTHGPLGGHPRRTSSPTSCPWLPGWGRARPRPPTAAC
jgi:dCTP deaminase